MRERAPTRAGPVVAPADDPPAEDDHGADRHLILRACGARLVERERNMDGAGALHVSYNFV